MSDEIAVRNSAGHTVSDRLARREHEFLEFVEYVLDVAEWAVFQRFMEGRRPFEIAEDMNRSVVYVVCQLARAFEYYETIILSREGYSQETIAQELNVSQGTVSHRLDEFRSFRGGRTSMEQEEDER